MVDWATESAGLGGSRPGREQAELSRAEQEFAPAACNTIMVKWPLSNCSYSGEVGGFYAAKKRQPCPKWKLNNRSTCRAKFLPAVKRRERESERGREKARALVLN